MSEDKKESNKTTNIKDSSNDKNLDATNDAKLKKFEDKIKNDNGEWGAKDLWGDFDLLIGAYKNNLKIIDVENS